MIHCVSSTENGIIFGNIVYDARGSAGESNWIVLSDIRIDILEYIQPATCSNAEFRRMWSVFEWENKVTVSTQVTDLHTYLDNVTKITNFRCLTPPEALRGECNYLCATLYACSVFGEHVLGNLCLEKPTDDAPVSGHVRIRAKTQGMAVTMGDKVSYFVWPWDLRTDVTAQLPLPFLSLLVFSSYTNGLINARRSSIMFDLVRRMLFNGCRYSFVADFRVLGLLDNIGSVTDVFSM
ncbi:unnamed protein product [Mesocestoides corti]|uniref:Coatomer beta subunit appendage platform domain-containing protein n=1 Tax=Mesocestoides corti TaxID=53468 RepID=A0A0R3U9J9_MESCO|nr:unnamed protein product [Mesocestoides corti]